MDADKLKGMALERLRDYIADEFFDYHGWDDKIECDETLTTEELEWMREHIEFTVTAEVK